MKRNTKEIPLIKFIRQRLNGYAWVFVSENNLESFRVFEHVWDALEYGNKSLGISWVDLDLLRIMLNDKKNQVAYFNSKKELTGCGKGRTK